jgi:MFS family permease
MGVFFSFYFVLMTLGPPVAGWLFDLSGDPFAPILFAIGLFGLATLAYRLFWVLKRRVAVA